MGKDIQIRQADVARKIWSHIAEGKSYCVEPSRQTINKKIKCKLRIIKDDRIRAAVSSEMKAILASENALCSLHDHSPPTSVRASKVAQKGVPDDGQVSPSRYNQGDVRAYETKPGKGRVATKRLRVMDALERAVERGKLTPRQLEASRKVERLVTRCSVGGGRGRDSCCMGEVGGGEQTDASAERQAQAMQTMLLLCTLMDYKTWLAVRDISLGLRVVRHWRDTSVDVRNFRLGCDIAADFWKIPTYGASAADKS